MEHHTHYDGSRAGQASEQPQQQQQQQEAAHQSSARPSGSASAAAAAHRPSPFVRRLQRFGIVSETRPLVGLWILGYGALGWLMYRSMGEHLRVRNADRALRTGVDLDFADEKREDRERKAKGRDRGGGGGGGGGESAAAPIAASFTPANQVSTASAPSPSRASPDVTANSRAVSAFHPLPSTHNAYTHATMTRVHPTGDREIGTVDGAELWSTHDADDLDAVLSLVESPIGRTQTLHRAVLKLMAIERDMLPMISFPEYNFE